MKIILSPAKIMSLENQSDWKKKTIPVFIDYSKKLHEILKEYSPSELENLLDISPKLSFENWKRNQAWKPNPSKNEGVPAIFGFKGEVYRGLSAENLSSENLNYLQKNLFILSGLYGVLHPSDIIMPYRLEMGKKLKTEHSKDLYEFWRNLVTEYLNSQLKKEEPILNLTSKEYFKVFDYKSLHGNVYTVEFKNYKDGKLKSIVVYFKNARGKMTRWCAKNNIKNIEDIKTFNEDGYEFSDKLSKKNNLVFIR